MIKAWLESVGAGHQDRLGLRLLHGKAALNPILSNSLQRKVLRKAST